jgi:2-oxoisovalerate dehydrogenase E1 component
MTRMKGSAVTTRPETSVAVSSDEALTRDDLLHLYRTMLLSRRLDDKEIQLKNQNRIFFQISGAGHEAITAVAAFLLRRGEDWAYPYYRDRAFALMMGVTPHDMLLQGVGAAADTASGGRQMPSHWTSVPLNIVSSSSPTGTQALQAVGCAEATLLIERNGLANDPHVKYAPGEITYMSIGDGATSEGEFWESMNAACLAKAPLLCVVEDNGYAISVPVEFQTPGGDISNLLASFPHLHIVKVDGTDVVACHAALREAIAYVRARKGPALVHAKVIRPYSHSLSDDERLYKTPEEREAEAARDPITRLADHLLAASLVAQADLDAFAQSVDAEVQDATDRALGAPTPSPDTAEDFVFSPDFDPTSDALLASVEPEGKPDTMVAAINRTIAEEMALNPRAVVFGQDVADASRESALPVVVGKGGVFKVTHGLQKRFGSSRVFNAPIAEAAIVGRATGMATRGLKPIVEIQFFDYIWPAMLQIRDELTMLRYRSNNTFSAPLVIRAPIGGYLRGGGPYHSQSGESIFAHCPGIRIVYPSNATDAAGLLRTAIRCEDPVLFLEHKHLYRQTYNKAPYPGNDYTVPFGKLAVKREGTDVVIITWGALVQRSLLAAQQAEKDGISAMVVDLRSIMPYDWAGISAAVRATNRVIVAHEDQRTCGFGAELAARIAEELFEHLDAPIKRVAALDTPVAYCPDLEERILPQAADVLAAIRAIARY